MNQEELEAARFEIINEIQSHNLHLNCIDVVLKALEAAKWTIEHKPKWDAMKEQPAPVDVDLDVLRKPPAPEPYGYLTNTKDQPKLEAAIFYTMVKSYNQALDDVKNAMRGENNQ